MLFSDWTRDTENGTDGDNYGFHCNMQNTSHCTKTPSLVPLATFCLFISLGLGIGLSVAQCEHTIKHPVILERRRNLYLSYISIQIYVAFHFCFYASIYALKGFINAKRKQK